jgi:hypothetical protein
LQYLLNGSGTERSKGIRLATCLLKARGSSATSVTPEETLVCSQNFPQPTIHGRIASLAELGGSVAAITMPLGAITNWAEPIHARQDRIEQQSADNPR